MFMHIIVILGIQSSFETILEGLIIIISILFKNGDCKQLKIVPLNLKIPSLRVWVRQGIIKDIKNSGRQQNEKQLAKHYFAEPCF